MEVLLVFIVALLAAVTYTLYQRNVALSKQIEFTNEDLEAQAEITRLNAELAALRSVTIDPRDVVPKSVHEAILSEKQGILLSTTQELVDIKAKYEQERGKAISERVRLGHVSENFAAFLDSFPYDRSKVKAMFQPIDMIYFGDDEIVFIDIKSGDSKLNEKQRNIKKLVAEGKVRFEVHQINEDGYTIK